MNWIVYRRICSILIAGVLLVSCVGCGNQEGTDDTDTTAVTTAADEKDSSTSGGLTISLTAPADAECVMIIDGDSVTKDEYTYCLTSAKNAYDSGDESYWTVNPEMKEKADAMAFNTVKRNHAIVKACADNGITLSSSDLAQIKTAYNTDAEEYGGQELYHRALVENGATEWVNLYFRQVERLEEKLMEYWMANGTIPSDDGVIRAKMNSDAYIQCKHIILTMSGDASPKDQLKQINTIHAKLINGEDFDTLMKQYSEDQNADAGDLFCKGVWTDADYENAAFTLGTEQFSDVIKTVYGYVILKRVEKNDKQITSEFDDLKQYDQLAELEMQLRTVIGEQAISELEGFQSLSAFSSEA